MEPRKERIEAIVRDILRRRHVGELPTPASDGRYDDLMGQDGEFEIRCPSARRRRTGFWRKLVHWLFRDGGIVPS